MKAILKKVLPQSLVRRLGLVVSSAGGTYLRASYAQEGEDLILERLLGERKSGFYVDVGAHHPRRFSNTFRFYKRGWHGINIEPNPQALKLFQRQRKRDINLGFGIAETETDLTYYMFNEPALNSFDRVLSEQRQDQRYRIVETKIIAVKPLASLLGQYMPVRTAIDFMTIDVEGLDLQVLRSNDWTHFRPICVLVECEHFDLRNPGAHDIHTFMEAQNFAFFAKTLNTLFYIDNLKRDALLPQARTP